MKRTILIAVMGLILSFVFNYAYAQEKITLSTYYPAPYGEYRKLAIGSSAGGYTAPTSAEIDLVVEGGVGIGTTSPLGKLHVNSVEILGNSSDDDGDGFIDEYEDVIFTTNGNVGIGTTAPQAKLHVGGTAGTDGIMFPDGTLQRTAGGVPVGSIMPYAGSSASSGWLLCNGSTLTQGGSGQIYEALYNVIGTTYGGTGANDFKLPDLRGRAAIGAGTGVGLSPRTLADEIGEENHQLTINEMPSHTHLLLTNEHRDTNTNIMPGSNDYIAQRGQGGQTVNYGEYDIAKGSGISPSVGKARETGGGATHNNMQPSLVLNFIIKY